MTEKIERQAKSTNMLTEEPNFQVEDNYPVPPIRKRHIYPFGSMEVGQSFAVPEGFRTKIYSAAAKYSKDKKFIVRKNGDGYRCWRIK